RQWCENIPVEKHAGATYGPSRTIFDQIRDQQVSANMEALGPFESASKWELAKWLVKNVGHNQAEEFLKLALVSIRQTDLGFKTKDQLYQKIDELPSGVGWKCQEVHQQGDLTDTSGAPLTETLEVWYRDPIECIRELIGNPQFTERLAYAPQRVYRDFQGNTRHIDEMWTGNWWWETQLRLPDGATVIPVILSTDKTRLSQFRGDKSAWPVYLTIGNLSKETRRTPSMHGTTLLGYLPVGKFGCFSAAVQSLARYQAFHTCMRIILDSLVEAGKSGVFMGCADRQIRRGFPILAAYVADYPEQCLVAACMENRCPTGQVSPDRRGEHTACTHRNLLETIELLDAHRSGPLSPEMKQRFIALGLRAIHEPFWRDLPHTDIFTCFTPDLLHQLHKGVFKDHLVKWCTALVGVEELDKRFCAAPTLTDLRHFKNGISHVQQWTGHEHKQMEKIFVALIAGGVDDKVLMAVRAILDFIYLASLHSHTSHTLAALRHALDTFHAHKQVFIDHGARHPEHFNIPKYHMLEHYYELIVNLGSADGFNTEWSERLHIDYAKDAYRASNKKDYIIQMTRWLSRQETIDRFSVYLEWLNNGEYHALPTNTITDRNSTAIAYKVAKQHPRSLIGIPASSIIEEHGATEFLPALHTFLRSHGSSLIPHTFDRFDLYKKLVVQLPSIPEVSDKKLKNVIRATPPVAAGPRRSAQPA
ncbi:hypothetical protein BDW22DRAFT_1318377, partial [Trametopsis cervina]